MSKRNTKTKRLILESLRSANTAMSQDGLQSLLGDAVDRATIYRALNSFSEDGLVHRVVGDDGKQYFAVCLNCDRIDHVHTHFHFRCTSCGKVECMRQELDLHLPEGYRISGFNAVISGTCDTCTADSRNP